MDFEKAFALILSVEGGYVNNPNDPGGKTKFGISQQAFPDVDIENLTINDAKAIYEKEFWDRCRCAELPDPLSLFVFDAAVHMGTFQAALLLQRTLGVKEDGIIGAHTMAAAKQGDPAEISARFLGRRALALAAMPTFASFGHGWMNRLFTLALAV